MADKNTKKPNPKGKNSTISLYTNSGHSLTTNESLFIDEYIATGNGTQSVVAAGYKCKSPRQYAVALLSKDYIAEEIRFRLDKLHSEKVADAQEVLEYFTSVMRGEVKDQFGLDAPLSERTRAAQELAKRQIDMVNRGNGGETAEVKIVLDWSRPTAETEQTSEESEG